MIQIRITGEAVQDSVEGINFYEAHEAGAGDYFASCLKGDIAGVRATGGIHRETLGFHRALSRVFPYAIYYRHTGKQVAIIAVIDTRRDPEWIRNRLKR